MAEVAELVAEVKAHLEDYDGDYENAEKLGEVLRRLERGDQLGEPVVSVVRLPDGRWATRNERDTSDVTREDVAQIAEAFRLWAMLLWERRRGCGWLTG